MWCVCVHVEARRGGEHVDLPPTSRAAPGASAACPCQPGALQLAADGWVVWSWAMARLGGAHVCSEMNCSQCCHLYCCSPQGMLCCLQMSVRCLSDVVKSIQYNKIVHYKNAPAATKLVHNDGGTHQINSHCWQYDGATPCAANPSAAMSPAGAPHQWTQWIAPWVGVYVCILQMAPAVCPNEDSMLWLMWVDGLHDGHLRDPQRGMRAAAPTPGVGQALCAIHVPSTDGCR